MWLGLIQLLGLGLLVAIGLATWGTARRLRVPSRRTYAFAVARNLPGDPSELDDPREFVETDLPGASGARFPAWIIPGDAPGGPVVVCSPGWGDSRLGVLPRVPALAPHCSRIVAWDPPGLGEAPGKCDLGTTSPSHLRAIVRSIHEEDPERDIVLMGWSLGAGVSIAAASGLADPPIAGVIAEAPYRLPPTPARNVIRLAGLPHRINIPLAFAAMGLRMGVGPRWNRHSPFDRAELARGVACPMLVLHGSADTICPVEDSGAIVSAAPDAELVEIEGAGHNNVWTDERFTPSASGAIGGFLSKRI